MESIAILPLTHAKPGRTINLAKLFTILYEEAAEEDLRGLRVFEARRIMDEVDAQLTKNLADATRRKKLLEGLAPP